jgi:hypothetical protein
MTQADWSPVDMTSGVPENPDTVKGAVLVSSFHKPQQRTSALTVIAHVLE